jgi:restriction system protein
MYKRGKNMNLIESIDKYCPRISNVSSYWLVRTNGGVLFNPFVKNEVIALGYSKISITDICNSVGKSPEDTFNNIRSIAEIKYPEHERPGLIASQIVHFMFDIKKGDYVIIPDLSTDRVAIGIVEEDSVNNANLYKEFDDKKILITEFNKVKKVTWMKTLVKRHINPNLYKLFFTHQAIVLANEYSKYIDSMLYDFYKKNDEYHLTIDVARQEIPAFVLFKGYIDLLNASQKFCAGCNCHDSISDINISINLNSPGKVELWGKRIGSAIFITGAIIVAVNGGGFKFKIEKLGLDAELSTPGIIKSVDDFLNSEANRDMKKELTAHVKELSISDPESVVTILAEINNDKKEVKK